jgi:hypothetical protein
VYCDRLPVSWVIQNKSVGGVLGLAETEGETEGLIETEGEADGDTDPVVSTLKEIDAHAWLLVTVAVLVPVALSEFSVSYERADLEFPTPPADNRLLYDSVIDPGKVIDPVNSPPSHAYAAYNSEPFFPVIDGAGFDVPDPELVSNTVIVESLKVVIEPVQFPVPLSVNSTFELASPCTAVFVKSNILTSGKPSDAEAIRPHPTGSVYSLFEPKAVHTIITSKSLGCVWLGIVSVRLVESLAVFVVCPACSGPTEILGLTDDDALDEGLTLGLALGEADGLIEGLTDGEIDGETDTLGETDTDGLTLTDGLTEGDSEEIAGSTTNPAATLRAKVEKADQTILVDSAAATSLVATETDAPMAVDAPPIKNC